MPSRFAELREELAQLTRTLRTNSDRAGQGPWAPIVLFSGSCVLEEPAEDFFRMATEDLGAIPQANL